jgi:DegV family protein with EDD domain
LYNQREKIKGETMEKVRIITDSNSGILQSEAEALGIFVIPMPFMINEEEYEEEISISQEKFYQLLEGDPSINTSCPAPGYLTNLWDEQLQNYDSIVYIPMSSGLSSTCDNSKRLAQEYNGKVQVAFYSAILNFLRLPQCYIYSRL